jgi:RNA polymerase-interacting CarD/CdnL/TRCF family regulator
MRLSVGSKVSYPLQGPCLIGPVVTKIVDGAPANFHHLILLGGGGAEFFVPYGQALSKGVRRLLDKSEVPAVLERLKKPRMAGGGHRAADQFKLCASGSALELAEAIASLTAMRGMNRFVATDYGMLERARRLLIREIAEVMGESDAAAEARIDAALGELHGGAAQPKKRRARAKARSAA